MYIFKFADIGEGIHEGKVSDILVKEGDSVNDGTDLFSVETDKITTEISSPVKGVISKILIKVGETIHVGDAIFEIDDSNSSSPAVAATPAAPAVSEEPKGESKGASVVGEVKVSDAVLPLFGSNSLNVTKSSSANNEVVNKDVLASPVARAFAKSHNVNLGLVKGTGELGRITKADVETYLNSSSKVSVAPVSVASVSPVSSGPAVAVAVAPVQTATVATAASSTLVANKVNAITPINEGDKTLEMTSIRKAIAAAMKRSWTQAAYTNLSVEIDVTEVWDQRNKIKDYILETENVKLNLLPFIIKAIAKTLKQFPMFNAVNDDVNNTLILRNEVNIGIAVDTKDGLIVPNIKNADSLSILEIAKTISEIATKARTKKITMADLSKGTFSVTNYGSLGVEFGVPVINYPEVAIAGLGAATNKVKKVGIQMVERKVMILTIAADHRWVDGGDIARFANQVKQYLENIAFLFV
ncbi:MAG: 2-oxo acid dehydrogenase subunit E2 [Malacoplasma sp.]|nr:2-oxo acid dehydrogenase subunit E2 [Malacoplasma sp.]MDE5774781.1 2-oxo acid dehydrogenase subunit E2 [Malacoplasma sp.]